MAAENDSDAERGTIHYANTDLSDQSTVRKGSTIIDPVIEKRLLRKLDIWLTPLVAFLCMEKDLKLRVGDYDWLLTIFYIAYIVFQFQGFAWRIFKPHNWAFCITIAWGIFSTAQAATQNWAGMMALRFLLGAAEAGFGPSIPFLLSFFYKRREVGLRCGIFLSAAPLASTFAGALAYGITSGHPKLASWRLLYLVEGIPTLLAACLAWYLLPDGPAHARYLTEEEREVAKLRALRQHGQNANEKKAAIDIKDIGRTLIDLKAWFFPLMYFSLNVSYSSLPVFLPTILNEMGFSAVNAQGLSAPPYFVSFLVTILTCWIADRYGQRGFMIMFLSVIGGIGYILLATCKSVAPRYFGVYLAAAGVFPAIGNILPWVINNQGSDTRRASGIILLNLIGQCGPLLGTRVFPQSQAPYYVEGQSICAAFLFFNACLAMALRTLLVWENKKLDQKYGPIGKEGLDEKNVQFEQQQNGEENYGTRFRYVL